jgi:hypothetical protein
VVDPEGHVVLVGTTPAQPDQSFTVEFEGRLPPGQYTAMAEILVNGNAMNPEIERIPVAVGARR